MDEKFYIQSKGKFFQFVVEPAITQGRILTQSKLRFFSEPRIYSQNFLLHKHKPNICRICRIAHKTKEVQNLQNSEFGLRIHSFTNTNPTFAEFAELATNKKGSESAELTIHSSQTKPKFAELLRKTWFGICTTQNSF